MIVRAVHFRNEGKVLQEFEDIFNDGFVQMENIKQKMLCLNTDFQLTSSQVLVIIKEEYEKLKNLNNKFDDFRKNVQDTNQKCIVTVKECQDREAELKNEHPQEAHRLNEKQQKMIELKHDKETTHHRHNRSVATYNFEARNSKEFHKNTTLGMFILTPLITILVFKKSLQEATLAVIPVCGIAFGILQYYKNQSINKVRENILILEEKEKNIAEIIKSLKPKLRKIDIDVSNISSMIEKEIKKSEVFHEIIKLICNFQIIIRKWQEPLDLMINIFMANNVSTKVPEKFIQRQEKFIKTKVNEVMAAAKNIYQKQTFNKFFLPVTVVKIDRSIPCYEFKSRIESFLM